MSNSSRRVAGSDEIASAAVEQQLRSGSDNVAFIILRAPRTSANSDSDVFFVIFPFVFFFLLFLRAVVVASWLGIPANAGAKPGKKKARRDRW